ncbi:zona pellucida sperm-binding protein 3-like [Narcine bancroftii]|uniref:zona pellucida sperm-binding protein 3-like n=1 Tax=Narcine bancroftii TaxID=1343680 RepID=UPI0038316FCF
MRSVKESWWLVPLLVGAVCCTDVWRQFRGQKFPWKKVKSTAEPAPGPRLRAAEAYSGSPLRTVVVACGQGSLLVTANLDLFGTRHLIKAADLTLGSANCPATDVSRRNSTAVFNYGLQECGNDLQMFEDFLVYSTHLTHTPKAYGAIVRTNGAVIPIQCRYFRKGNVSSHPVKPTWIPFSSTKAGEGRLSFSLRLMNDGWFAERSSNVYYLGDLIHIEASVSLINHMPLKLYIDQCVASLSPSKDSTPRYTIIDFHGCLVDSTAEDSFSAFVLPEAERELDKLRFDLDAFRFFGDDRALIFITCRLKVAAVNQSDSMNKACTFQKPQNVWTPLEAQSADICACCSAGNCGAATDQLPPSRGRRGVMPLAGNDAAGMRWESEVSLGPLVILDVEMPRLAAESLNNDEQRATKYGRGLESDVILAVALTVTALSLISTTSIILFLYKKRKQTLLNNLN